MVKVKFDLLDENSGKFIFEGVSVGVVNSIRRYIIQKVPTFAIEDVEIIENGSPLYDETLAHRLGLVPLKTDLKSYNFKNKCKCGGIGCALCEVKMVLKKEEPGYVYSGEIKSDDPVIIPVDEKIPLTKIIKGQKVHLNMKAILGTGLEHIKWSPAHVYHTIDEKEKISLFVESYGQLDVKTIFNKALDIIIEDLKELEGSL